MPEKGINGLIELPLEEKEKISLKIIRAALAKACNPYVSFSGGKRSLVLLHMARRSQRKLKALHIDTGAEFDNLLLYMEKMRRLWGFDLLRTPSGEKQMKPDHKKDCCKRLILEPQDAAVVKHKIDCLLIGSSYEDENWSDQIASPENNVRGRVYPILHLTDEDIWAYIEEYNLPYCSLYDQGYRRLDCEPCSPLIEKDRMQGVMQDEARIKESFKRLGYL